MAMPMPRDAGIARGTVKLRQVGTLREFPRKRMLTPARPHEEHSHGASVVSQAGLRTAREAQDSWMVEPGLDLHEWETRWEQLLEIAEEAPADAGAEMDRLLEEMLRERHLFDAEDEARKQFEAARDLMRRYEAGGGSPGDLGEAIKAYRLLYEYVTAGFPAP